MIAAVWMIVKAFLSKNALMVGMIAGAIALFATYDTSRVNAGIEKQKHRQVKIDETATNKARDAQRRVRPGTAVKRLRKEFCRDC